ncbi:MAG: hypothetical protein HFG34_03735 [Eubacterium sp.]|nr:hypothetical protein [Eubacterium sp.]
MKKKLFLMCIICIGVYLCGCEGELKTAYKGESPPADSPGQGTFGVKYCSVSELKRTKMSDITYKADNLRLPAEVDFSGIGEVAVLDMETEQNDVMKKKKSCKKLFGIGGKEIWKKENDLLVYDDEKERQHCVIGEAGFLCYSKYEKKEYEYSMKESYDLRREDISEVKVGLKDGAQPLLLMCNRARKWLEDNMEIKGFYHKVADAYILEQSGEDSSDSPEMLELSVEYEYKGIPVCNFSSLDLGKGPNKEDGVVDVQPSVFPFGVRLHYTASDEMKFFSNLGGRLKLKEAEKMDQIVDLESAIRIVHENLSGLTYRFDDIVPLYILNPSEIQSGQSGFKPGIRVKGTPVYAFIRNVKKGSSEIEPNCGEYYCLVDMISGEFRTNFDGPLPF